MSDDQSSPVEHGHASQRATPVKPGDVPSRAEDESSSAARNLDLPREYGGRKGPEPVRYGDWEKNGRCIDF